MDHILTYQGLVVFPYFLIVNSFRPKSCIEKWAKNPQYRDPSLTSLVTSVFLEAKLLSGVSFAALQTSTMCTQRMTTCFSYFVPFHIILWNSALATINVGHFSPSVKHSWGFVISIWLIGHDLKLKRGIGPVFEAYKMFLGPCQFGTDTGTRKVLRFSSVSLQLPLWSANIHCKLFTLLKNFSSKACMQQHNNRLKSLGHVKRVVCEIGILA